LIGVLENNLVLIVQILNEEATIPVPTISRGGKVCSNARHRTSLSQSESNGNCRQKMMDSAY